MHLNKIISFVCKINKITHAIKPIKPHSRSAVFNIYIYTRSTINVSYVYKYNLKSSSAIARAHLRFAQINRHNSVRTCAGKCVLSHNYTRQSSEYMALLTLITVYYYIAIVYMYIYI